MRSRLTYRESSSVWGVFGVDINKLPENVYNVARKLFEYEETGLKPSEIADLETACKR